MRRNKAKRRKTRRGKSKRKTTLRVLLFVSGLLFCIYPLISSFIEHRYEKKAVATYKSSVAAADSEKLETLLAKARAYNDMLWQTNGVIVGNVQKEILDDESYQNQLNISEDGMMGVLSIPKINVNLPVYHGTEDAVLQKGAGHVQESSLPVGAANTHCLLTGHRGLANSKMLTRLDEMEPDDFFFIETCNEKLAYQVSEIEVIKPEDVGGLGIQEEKDLVSLITCTPYGLNTHRLVVTGERVPYVEAEEKNIPMKPMSIRELVFTALPFLFLAVGILNLIKKRKGKGSIEKQ